jgi:hypothetical protein
LIFIDIVYLLIHLGSDSTSAFFGKGKTRTWQVARDEEKYFEGFESLGNELDVSDQVISILEKYVCHLYGQPKISSVNEARYQMFRLGKCSEESLPPNSDSLHQHILRVNYEAFIRKQSTINTISAPSPDGYGWTVEGTDLNIKCGTMESAPDSILEYVMCRYKKADLQCTELCQCGECENMESTETDSDIDNELDEDSDDDDNEF